jgi:hypothetical protein
LICPASPEVIMPHPEVVMALAIDLGTGQSEAGGS